MPVSHPWHTAVAMAPRPVPFTPEQRAAFQTEIVEWISEGRTLREYCRQEGRPTFQTVYVWRDEDEDFAGRFARARSLGHDAILQECQEIADDASNDWMERVDEDGHSEGWRVNGDHVSRSKLRVWTRLELLKRWDPQRFGDKVAVGGDPSGVPIKVENQGPTPPPIVDLITGAARLADLARGALGTDDAGSS